jgi:hypothetical protein
VARAGRGVVFPPLGREGWEVNILEDARHSSVLYLYRIFFAIPPFLGQKFKRLKSSFFPCPHSPCHYFAMSNIPDVCCNIVMDLNRPDPDPIFPNPNRS